VCEKKNQLREREEAEYRNLPSLPFFSSPKKREIFEKNKQTKKFSTKNGLIAEQQLLHSINHQRLHEYASIIIESAVLPPRIRVIVDGPFRPSIRGSAQFT
jgi:hypothetical protein